MKLNRTLGLLIVATATVGAAAAVGAATSTTTTATTTATTPAPAGKHWHHHRGGLLVGGLLRATKQLGLTDQQETTIKGILTTARSQHQAAATAAGAVDMTVLSNPGDPNYATALQTAKSRFEARMQSESELQSQIYNVLTPEQKAKLPTVLASLKAQAEQRRAAWQAAHPAAATGAAGSN
jgi:Spy/CpxP family protein refolding chaperone